MPLQVPDPPLILAGGVGGPMLMYAVTPLRNALTYGSMDAKASFGQLYKKAFLKNPFAGGHFMAAASCPGFLVLGPAFHVYNDVTGSNMAACGLAGISETIILYGSETRNSQVAFNVAKTGAGGAPAIPTARLQSIVQPLGPGMGLHVVRNILAMSGLRVFSTPIENQLEKAIPGIAPEAKIISANILANIGVSAVTVPIHQAYQFQATQRLASAALGETGMSTLDYLKKQYLTNKGTISKVALRDISLRTVYSATIYTVFGIIERSCVRYWPRAETAER